MDGHEVHTAYDGLEALEMAARVQPDFILLDLSLPKLNGYEVARRIREQDPKRSVALVALTGWSQEEVRRRAEEAGFDAHITKPVHHTELEKLLARRPVGEKRES